MGLCTLSRTFVCCALVGLGGCGGSDSGDRTQPFEQTPLRRPAESGHETRTACSLVSGAAERASNSTDLSICHWSAAGRRFELVLDTAPRAQLRFYNQLSEQLEYYNQDPLRRPYQLKGVGDDTAYGGAGAWWTKTKKQLIAYSDNRILRVRAPDKASAARVARAAFRKLSEPAA